MTRPFPCILLAMLTLAACSRDPDTQSSSTDGDAGPDTPVAARVTVEEFGRLRWLEGRWRGAEGAGAPFYESYRFIDDSTIQQFTYADSTFSTISDSGLVRLRADTETSGWPAPRYVATAIAADSVYFAALPGASNDFTWRSAGQGMWTARLLWDSAGVAKQRVYEMRAVP